MRLVKIDLYEYYGLERPEGARAELSGWIQETSWEVSRDRKRPAVLVIPGGGYCFVSDREAEPVAYRFLARGYVPFVLRYSITPHGFPTQLREAAMAMRYIREQAESFGVDPTTVGAIGFSAGGHLCGTLGTMYDCPELACVGTPEQIRPDALALCYPVTLGWGPTHEETMDTVSCRDPELRQRLSLDTQVRPDMPPTFLWHTRDDDLVPCRNSILLAQAMDEQGVDFSFHLYRHGWHGLSLADDQVYATTVTPGASWDVPGWMDACIRFWADAGLKTRDK